MILIYICSTFVPLADKRVYGLHKIFFVPVLGFDIKVNRTVVSHIVDCIPTAPHSRQYAFVLAVTIDLRIFPRINNNIPTCFIVFFVLGLSVNIGRIFVLSSIHIGKHRSIKQMGIWILFEVVIGQ